MNVIETKELRKQYRVGQVVTNALDGVDISIAEGEFVSIIGKSGAGKSTLLYQLSLLDDPTSGSVMIQGNETAKLSRKEKTQLRLDLFGYVFQDYALIPELTALENVMLPLIMKGCSMGKCSHKAKEQLERVGLKDRVHNRPGQLSGGEQQRVSIARALVNEPAILCADEPTANLDSETSRVILDIILDLHKHGQTIVMVTHESDYAQMAERIITMSDGKIIGA